MSLIPPRDVNRTDPVTDSDRVLAKLLRDLPEADFAADMKIDKTETGCSVYLAQQAVAHSDTLAGARQRTIGRLANTLARLLEAEDISTVDMSGAQWQTGFRTPVKLECVETDDPASSSITGGIGRVWIVTP